MKFLFSVVSLVCLVFANEQISIVHVNDIHSHIISNKMSLHVNGKKIYANVGGYPRLVSKIKELQKEENVITLNAGDMIRGTSYYTLFNGEVDAKMTNQIKWDAIVFGNHEFDDGDIVLASHLNKLESKILAANIKVPKSNPLYGKFFPSVIKTLGNGKKVGIIGIDISGITKGSSCPSKEVEFLNELQSAQKQIDEFLKEGIDKIILLTHVGLDNDKLYASALHGVDIIVGGHSHSLMGDFSSVGLENKEPYPLEMKNKDGKKVCIVQAGSNSNIVGNLIVDFDENGNVLTCKGNPTLLLGDEFWELDQTWKQSKIDEKRNNEILAFIKDEKNLEVVKEDLDSLKKIEPYKKQIEKKMSKKVGVVSENLTNERIPTKENLGSQIAPLVAKSFVLQSKSVDACIINAGNIRTPLYMGELKIGNIYKLLPFKNTLFEFKMSSQEIKEVLEDGIDKAFFGGDEKVISTGAFPYAYGIKYEVNILKEKGKRVENIEILEKGTKTWVQLKTNKMYTIVTNDYIAQGKDGYITFKNILEKDVKKGLNTYKDQVLSFIKFVKSQESLKPLPLNEFPIKKFSTH